MAQQQSEPPLWRVRAQQAARNFPPPRPHALESLRGPGNSNVILKGCALAGPHPGDTSPEIVANLMPLLRAGVTCFVNLQQELFRRGAPVDATARRGRSGGPVVSARDYLVDAQTIVDAGGLPQTGGPRLSLL